MISPACDTYRGPHRDIGQQIGIRHGWWIRRTVAHFVQHHDIDIAACEYEALADGWLAHLQAKAPRLLEQLEGVHAASGVPLADLLAMNFRFWNLLAARRQQHPDEAHHCTNIVLRDPDEGILLGGSLDDIASPWYLARFEPKGGLRHLCVTWIGSAWAGRGINEAGLAVGGSSMPVDGMQYDMARRFDDLAVKLVLEEAENVDQAIAILKHRGAPYKGTLLMMADRQGQGRMVEMGSPSVVVHNPGEEPMYCVNCVESLTLRQEMEACGYRHQPSAWAESRRRVIDRCFREHASEPGMKLMKSILRNHDGFPESICHPNAVYHTIAVPQASTPGMWVSEGPSCRNGFKFMPVYCP